MTPLTERLFITMMAAMGMALGAALAGGPGTGKTETVRALGGTPRIPNHSNTFCMPLVAFALNITVVAPASALV